MIKALFICTIIFLSGCKGSTNDILSKKKMQEVLWDIIQADVYTNQYIRLDSSKNANEENVKLQQKIFSIHHISKNDFYKSYNYYQNHPTEMLLILDSLNAEKLRPEEKPSSEKMKNFYKPVKKI